MTTAVADTQSYIRDALQALQGRDGPRALAILAAAERAAPGDTAVMLNKALAYRVMGQLPSALAELNRLLAIDPYDFMALLSKAALTEQLHGVRLAAPIYRDALRIAPPEDRLPPGVKTQLDRARTVVDTNAAALADFLRERVEGVRQKFGEQSLARFEEALDVFAGRKKVYHSEPINLHYPQLPAIPFFERSHFPWMDELEAATDMIRGELEGALAKAEADFAPYIDYPAGAPVNQWEELNRSRRWKSLWLWKDGVQQAGPCGLCPKTTALLQTLPMCDQDGFAPTALFSALAPHTHIPPHTGATNTRLLVHLPLILPGPARFRVGNEVREWRLGQAWAFDDTIEHEAWNDADELRVILIFDIWNPLLSEAERALVTEMMKGQSAYAI